MNYVWKIYNRCFNKVKKTALDEEIAKYVAYHRYYQRLIAIRFISEGHSIAEAARIMEKSTKQSTSGQKHVKMKD